jgi:hypothetical protein
MLRFIGCAEIPGNCLKYYVFGNRRKGYGVKITCSNTECTDYLISRNLFKVLNLANQFYRCKVFPENLCEILEDLNYEGCSN